MHPLVTRYAKQPLVVRIAATVALIAVAVLVLYPKGGNYYPEGNWLRGPLWMLLIQDYDDKIFGVQVAVPLLVLIFAYPLKPNWITGCLSVLGILLWIGCGAWLAGLAAA